MRFRGDVCCFASLGGSAEQATSSSRPGLTLPTSFALGSSFWIQQLHFFSFFFFFAPQKEKSTNNCVSDWFLMCILGSSGEANEERDITSGQPRPFKGTYYVPPLRHIGLRCWMLMLNVAKLSNNEVYVWKVIPFSRKLKEGMLTFRRWLPDDKKIVVIFFVGHLLKPLHAIQAHGCAQPTSYIFCKVFVTDWLTFFERLYMLQEELLTAACNHGCS